MCNIQNHENGCNNIYGKTTAEMTHQATFTNWDFTNESTNGTADIWRLCIDGTGYPRGLMGKEIGLYAKIIMVADTYDALTHTRAYHKRKLPLTAIKEIIDTRVKKYDSRVLKAFLEEITLFPVGCYVRLNNNEMGRVTGSMGGTHFRHVVEILFDSEGEPLETPRSINLMESPLLHIVEGIDERTLGIEKG